jgi:hypothetical protein
MPHSIAPRAIVAFFLFVSLGCAGAVSADAIESTYQIVRATDSRVWRLNTRSGEIAVCSLDGEQLVCNSSERAIAPPTKTYAELEGERQALKDLEMERRAEKRKRSLAMLDRMLSAFRSLAAAGADPVGTN